MPRTYKTEGVIIKRKNFGEADKILTIFTKQYGKLRGVAKGIRKLTSRKGGNLELFNYVAIFLAKGKNLDIITEVQAIESFPNFRKNLTKVALAYQFTQLINSFSQEALANQELFQLLIFCLKQLDNEKCDLDRLAFYFKTELLKISGFGLPKNLQEPSLNHHIEMIIGRKVQYFYG